MDLPLDLATESRPEQDWVQQQGAGLGWEVGGIHPNQVAAALLPCSSGSSAPSPLSPSLLSPGLAEAPPPQSFPLLGREWIAHQQLSAWALHVLHAYNPSVPLGEAKRQGSTTFPLCLWQILLLWSSAQFGTVLWPPGLIAHQGRHRLILTCCCIGCTVAKDGTAEDKQERIAPVEPAIPPGGVISPQRIKRFHLLQKTTSWVSLIWRNGSLCSTGRSRNKAVWFVVPNRWWGPEGTRWNSVGSHGVL